jgi:hypothetical protein
MAQRRFGPVRGAGVGIIERDGEKQISASALGIAGYAGILEKGRPGELIECFNRTAFEKKCGTIIDDSLLPDAAFDYYRLANGAGGIVLVRVTDGNERKASLTLYQRQPGARTPMGRIDADNGGRWGGREQYIKGVLAASGDLLNTTLQLPTGLATQFATDELKGAYITLAAVSNVRYPVIGNSATGLVTVASDQTMKDAWTAAATPLILTFYIELEASSRQLSVIVGDGEERPDSEFSLTVTFGDEKPRKYGNLHTDPDNARYWVNIINNDDSNDEIIAVDLVSGAHVADTRPANHYGVSSTLTDTVLTAVIHKLTINSPGGGNPTMTLGTTTDAMLDDVITITMSSATVGTAVSARFGTLGTVTLGTLFSPPTTAGGALLNVWSPPFTITAGASPLVATNTLVIDYKPFKASELIGGRLYPDKNGNKNDHFRIDANTHSTITVAAGSEMLDVAAAADEFLVEAAQYLVNGRDGNADVVDASYQDQAWDVDASPFNRVAGRNYGLVKYATPGVTSTAVQRAGINYAYAKNHQYREEIPENVTTDTGALAYVNDTIGRNDYAVVSFPSYGNVPHPDPTFAREGRTKSISLTGMIHGREARIAADYDGYHKAQAGVDATLPRILSLATGETALNEELLNPAGIGIIKKSKGNFVIWGDRTLQTDPAWKFKHHRELMSHYEQVLQENFDFIVFTINDSISDRVALSALRSFFIPEFTKRALRGNVFDDACTIKVDNEINTDAVRAAGDKFAIVSLLLADTTERFTISIGKQGIFENVSA